MVTPAYIRIVFSYLLVYSPPPKKKQANKSNLINNTYISRPRNGGYIHIVLIGVRMMIDKITREFCRGEKIRRCTKGGKHL